MSKLCHATPILVRRAGHRPAKSHGPLVSRSRQVAGGAQGAANRGRLRGTCRRGPALDGQSADNVLRSSRASGRQRWTTGCAAGPFEHAARRLFLVAVFIATLGLTPAVPPHARPFGADAARFRRSAGPRRRWRRRRKRQKAPPPKAEQEGRQTMSSPLPARNPPTIEPPPKPPEPETEPPPVIAAPVASVAADDRTVAGALEEQERVNDAAGPEPVKASAPEPGTGSAKARRGNRPGVRRRHRRRRVSSRKRNRAACAAARGQA